MFSVGSCDSTNLAHGRVLFPKVQPLLATVSTSEIAATVGVSRWYAGRIREGYRPHPRHGAALAQLVDRA